MPNLLEIFGESPQDKGSFQKTLFYFLKEIPIYPFDETYEIRNAEGKLVYTITKKGMSIVLFNSLITQMKEHHKKEETEMKEMRK